LLSCLRTSFGNVTDHLSAEAAMGCRVDRIVFALAEGEVSVPHLFVLLDAETWVARANASSLFTNKPWVRTSNNK